MIESVENSRNIDPSVVDATGSIVAKTNKGIFSVGVPVYEGPMDLLLYVVRQHQIDLLELPLAQVAKDFLEYTKLAENLDLDSAGEIIFIASILLRMKVRSLLPSEDAEEIEDPEAVAARDEELEEIYREIVSAARKLAEGEETQRKHFKRGNAARLVQLDETEEMLRDLSIVNLASAFRDISQKLESTPIHQLALFKVSVADQSKIILSALRSRKKIAFKEIVSHFRERLEAVVAFLAMLELIRYSRIRIKQDELFDTIWITRGPKFEEAPETEAEAGNE